MSSTQPNLFYDISKIIININNNYFSYNYKTKNDAPLLIKILFVYFINSITLYKNKFDFFYKSCNNIFLTDALKEQFLDLYCKIQKTYTVLRRFAYTWKYKKAKIVVHTDMGLNEIKENDKNIICIYQNNSKYLFHIHDIIKIMNTNLTNSHVFFAEPNYIKNPFNNLAFNKSTLYNIYFYIKWNTNLYPELIFKFFNVHFDLTYFLYNNEHLLREYTIKNYVMKSPNNVIHNEIMIMIDKHNQRCKKETDKIIIDAKFPEIKLIKIMKPYLLLYMNIIYSLIPIIKTQSQRELSYKLKKFQKFNPQFGKKIIKLEYIYFPNKRVKSTFVFNDKHLPFHEIDEFIDSHLKINYAKLYYHEEETTAFQQNEEEEDEEDEVEEEVYQNYYMNNNEIDTTEDTESTDETETNDETEPNDETGTNENNFQLNYNDNESERESETESKSTN